MEVFDTNNCKCFILFTKWIVIIIIYLFVAILSDLKIFGSENYKFDAGNFKFCSRKIWSQIILGKLFSINNK